MDTLAKTQAKADSQHRLARQTEAAKRLMVQLRANGDDQDKELVTDTIEGETNLFEAIEAAINEIDQCEALEIGLKTKEEEFRSRRIAIEKRTERLRAMIEQAMIAAEQTTIRLPTATITLKRKEPGLIILNEADIAAEFWIEQPRPAPKLDKKALLIALDEKRQIAGATLDNGSYSLAVRRK